MIIMDKLLNKVLSLNIVFILVIIGAAVLFSPTQVKSATCTLTGVNWTKQSVAIGEEVLLSVAGQGCDGEPVAVYIYEADPIKDDFIRIINGINFKGVTASITLKFSEADYITGGDEVGNETMYPEVLVGFDNKQIFKNRLINVVKPVAGKCQLSDAKWSWLFSAHPIVGSPLHMSIAGTGCAGYGVSFKIYSSEILADKEIAEVSGTFDSAGTKLDKVWWVDTSKDTRILSSRIGDYHLYFIASAGSAKVTSGTTLIPTNSQQGCINCNVWPVPESVDCADGSSISRGLFSDAYTACKDHIGDAHTDKAGTCTTCSGGTGKKYSCNASNACEENTSGTYTTSNCDNKCVSATASKSYIFNITNPLKGGPNDLFEIITIVTQWIIYIAVPLAVLWIMYAGFLMLTAGPKPENFKKGKDILWYTILGLAIIFIGKGFVTLIISIIQLGGTS